VRLHPIFRESVHREKEPEGVLELPRELGSQDVQIGGGHQVLLPLGLKQVVRSVERECSINLLTGYLERRSGIEVEQIEQRAEELLKAIPALLRVGVREKRKVVLVESIEAIPNGRRSEAILVCFPAPRLSFCVR